MTRSCGSAVVQTIGVVSLLCWRCSGTQVLYSRIRFQGNWPDAHLLDQQVRVRRAWVLPTVTAVMLALVAVVARTRLRPAGVPNRCGIISDL